MMPLYKRFEAQSSKNGRIQVLELFGRVTIFAGGFEQTGPYVTGLWRTALKHIPKETVVIRLLVIGLGGGGALRPIERRFPSAKITAIEWDPVMVDLAKQLQLYQSTPEIVVGDAFELLPTMQGQFDLILSDAFLGDTPEPRQGQDQHIRAMRQALTPDGRYIVNISRTPSLIQAIAKHMQLEETWTFKDNTVAMFRKSSE